MFWENFFFFEFFFFRCFCVFLWVLWGWKKVEVFFVGYVGVGWRFGSHGVFWSGWGLVFLGFEKIKIILIVFVLLLHLSSVCLLKRCRRELFLLEGCWNLEMSTKVNEVLMALALPKMLLKTLSSVVILKLFVFFWRFLGWKFFFLVF